MRLRRSHIGLVLFPALLVAGAAPVHAQLAFSASAESDYRFRGLSLSHGQPDVRLNLSYDHRSGAYAGLSLIGADDDNRGLRLLGYVDYAGYVVRPEKGPAWEVGATNMHVHGRYSYDFTEVYAGVVGEHISLRLSYAPHYFGRNWDNLYVDLSGGRRLSTHWRAFAHAGVATPLNGPFREERYDFSAGVAVSVRTYEIEMALTRTNPVPDYPDRPIDNGDGLLVTATAFF